MLQPARGPLSLCFLFSAPAHPEDREYSQLLGFFPNAHPRLNRRANENLRSISLRARPIMIYTMPPRA
jgi:hypothetical protein